MTRYLPPTLLAMFEARPPIEYLEPLRKRKMPPYQGIADVIARCNDPEHVAIHQAAEYTGGFESRAVKRRRQMEETKEEHEKKIKEAAKEYDPSSDPKADGDAYKTIFVGRLPFEVTEPALRREFETYGPVRKVKLIYDEEGKPRGYGFIEFERERDMRAAFKGADGRRMLGRRILVDVERGRTVKDWVPRRLGGGLGTSRPDLPPQVGKKSAGAPSRVARPSSERRASGVGAPRDDRPAPRAGGDDYRSGPRGGDDYRSGPRGGDDYRSGPRGRDDDRAGPRGDRDDRRGGNRGNDNRGNDRFGDDRRRRGQQPGYENFGDKRRRY